MIRDKGFYKATLFRKGFLGKKHFYGSVEFGIGDVYYVAGQSNASGYGGQGNNAFAGDDPELNWNSEEKFIDDNAISTTGEIGNWSPMTRVLSTRIDENNILPRDASGNQQPITIGTVYKEFTYRNVNTLSGFSEFKNGGYRPPAKFYVHRPKPDSCVSQRIQLMVLGSFGLPFCH
ncbi:MAG: hypothetical protein LRY55_00105 [Leadbetterella sp.]|nr:hypothetical protein [Leadbetterella sp.]